MKTITGLSATPLQRFQFPVNDEVAEFVLKYRPAIQFWYLDCIVGNIEIYNTRVCHNLNLYAQYSDILNWGIYISVNGIVEPILIDDFSTGRAMINIIDQDEIGIIEGGYSLLK